MCQPRLAVTRFNVPAKCHFGCLWNQCAIETLPHKDYLINRIISPSILSQLCDNVKREQENNQSIFVMKLHHPPSVVCSHLNHNEKWRYVFTQRKNLLLISHVFYCLAFVFCSKFPSSAEFSSHLSYDTVGHGEVLLFVTCRCTYFYRSIQIWLLNSITVHNLIIVKGMSISFCWGYLMLIKELKAHFAERIFQR